MIELMITSSVLILAVLLLRRLTKGKISMRLRYVLWLAVALRLILPVSVADSAFSVMNLLPDRGMAVGEGVLPRLSEGADRLMETGDGRYVPVGTEVQNDKDTAFGSRREESAVNAVSGDREAETAAREHGNGEPEGVSGNLNTQKSKEGNALAKINMGLTEGSSGITSETMRKILGILRIVWIVGALSVCAYMISSQVRFRRILYRRRSIVGKKRIPKELADRLAGRGINVYQVDGLASPCLVGRNIYVDTKLLKERQKFLHVLAHEYCHAKQFDSIWAFLRSALAAVYWFHPLVWAAAFAARQDSELACDEAVIRLLGEEERFAYGRTLLYLLSGGCEQIHCAGTALTMEGRKRDVKERVRMIAGNTERRGWTAVMAVMMMLLICGCAFTGSEQKKEAAPDSVEQAAGEEQTAETDMGQTDKQQTVGAASDEEIERLRKEYEAVDVLHDAQKQAVEQIQQDAAFLSALDYQGVMAGKDDGELALDREFDYQVYYEYVSGAKDGQQGAQKNPPETGWYLLCRNEEAKISIYGLYTKEFGPRGLKTMIGEDVNTYDIAWCPSGMNEDSANIRILEEAQDGFPRRFVFKLLAENGSDREIWKLYSGLRYDTGTVEMEELTAQMYRDWVDRNLSFTLSESEDQILITYDGDMVLEPLDISAYQDQKVKAVLLSPDVAGFELGSDRFAGEVREGQDSDEKVALHLAVGLQLEGMEGVWYDGLQPLTVQVLCQPGQEPAFVLQQPGVEEQRVLRSLSQERKLEEIRAEEETDLQSSDAEGYLSRPLVNREEGHHDLEIDFLNPCPGYDRISDGYGERIHPLTGEVKKHNGVDMAAEAGTSVIAAADGRVYETGFDEEDGNYVVLWHGQSGQMTYYTHCREVLVSAGQQVTAGDNIATVGSTGRSTGSHLHFAVSYAGEWQEPFWDRG